MTIKFSIDIDLNTSIARAHLQTSNVDGEGEHDNAKLHMIQHC